MEGLAIEGTGWGSCYHSRLSAKKCCLEADGMQKVELGGELSGTPVKIGNEGMSYAALLVVTDKERLLK